MIIKRSLKGIIVPLGKYKNQMIFWQIEAILQRHDATLKPPIRDLDEDTMGEIMNGSLETLRLPKETIHTTGDMFVRFDGVVK